jgi:hypothetical protein
MAYMEKLFGTVMELFGTLTEGFSEEEIALVIQQESVT